MSIQTYLNDDLPMPRADVFLLIASFATAIVDTMTFRTLQVFSANMTGNIIFLGMGIAQVPSSIIHPKRSITALCSFWAGSFLTGLVGHRVGTRKRWYLLANFTLQAVLIVISAALLWGNCVSVDDDTILGLITILAVAFGAQAAAGRPLGVAPITTVVVTSAMVDLFSDKNFFARITKNIGRNQRFAFILTFFVGGIVGSLILVHVNDATTLVVAAAVKFLAVGVLLIERGKKKPPVDVETSSKEKVPQKQQAQAPPALADTKGP